MSAKLIQVAEDFWNLRGSFRIGGVLDVGTHLSLVRRPDGRFVVLDAYTLEGAAKDEVDALTDGGSAIAAVINLHPFHTMHVAWAHENYPNARHYGTARHHARFPALPWQTEKTEAAECAALFAPDLEFSVPRGVDFISANESVHFSSVIAWHPASRTLHVDDTFMYVRMPGLVRLVGPKDSTSLHPTLARALEKRAGAADEFEAWAREVIAHWAGARNLCAAHTATLTADQNRGASIQDRLQGALDKAQGKLELHRKKYG